MDLETNPYSPPRAPIGRTTDEPRTLEIAGKGRRFITYLIDYIIFLLSTSCFRIVLGEPASESLGGLLFIISIAFYFGYYTFFEGIWGRTPGKLICGTKVVDERGGQPSFGQILRRSAYRLIPVEPVSFFRGKGWHDDFSKTLVVLVR